MWESCCYPTIFFDELASSTAFTSSLRKSYEAIAIRYYGYLGGRVTGFGS
jgi:hypothetical protein